MPTGVPLTWESYTVTDDGCWVWPAASCNEYGHSQWTRDGVRRLTHHWFYERYVGGITNGMKVLHACGNASCVNPDHLYLGTTQDNSDDMVAHGKSTAGMRITRMTHDEVREVRRLYESGERTQMELADEFGRCCYTIYSVVNYRTWADI